MSLEFNKKFNANISDIQIKKYSEFCIIIMYII